MCGVGLRGGAFGEAFGFGQGSLLLDEIHNALDAVLIERFWLCVLILVTLRVHRVCLGS